MSINKTILIGNVGKDPKIAATASGTIIASFPLATSERYKNKAGEQKEETQWHYIEVFGKSAEFVESYVQKGAKVYIEGKIKYDEWTAADGAKAKMTKIVVDSFNGKVSLLDKKQTAANESLVPNKPPSNKVPAVLQNNGPDFPDLIDDIPF